MNDSIQTINIPHLFKGIRIRTALTTSGSALFCAKDLCGALEIRWSGSGNTLKSIPKEWKRSESFPTQGGIQKVIFVNEAGAYRLIFRSSKPRMMEVANWVHTEVLPSIRNKPLFDELPATQRISYSRQLVALTSQLATTQDAMLHKLLLDELRDLCNLMGRPMPDILLMGKKVSKTES